MTDKKHTQHLHNAIHTNNTSFTFSFLADLSH